MNKKKIVKILLIILAIILVIFLVHTLRNFVIISGLQNKLLDYSNKTNYHIKSVANEENGTIVTMNYYKKDNKQAVFLERNLNGEITKVSMYDNGERTDTFTETKDSKIVKLNSGTIMAVSIYNQLETENTWQTFLGSIGARVESTKVNNKECYSISNFMSTMSLSYDKQVVYVDKDTGLFIKNELNQMSSEREYEFDNVNDNIFVEPDIGQYKIQED